MIENAEQRRWTHGTLYHRGSAGSNVDLKIEEGRIRPLFDRTDFRMAVGDALELPVALV